MRLWQYQGKAEPVSTQPETPELEKWEPNYPSALRRNPCLIAAIIAGSCFFSDLGQSETVHYDKWIPEYPLRLDPPKRVFWDGINVIDPLLLTLKEDIPSDKWLPDYPSQLYSKPYPHWTDIFVNDAFPFVITVPTEPPVKEPKPKHDPKSAQKFSAAITYGFTVIDTLQLGLSETVELEKWIPSYPSQLYPVNRILWNDKNIIDPTLLSEQEFPFVDKWISEYPNRLDPAKRTPPTDWTVLDPYIDHVATGDLLDKWGPVYPSRLDSKSRILWDSQVSIDPTLISDIPFFDKWTPTYPIIFAKEPRIIVTEWYSIDPLLDPAPEEVTTDRWASLYPVRLDRPILAKRMHEFGVNIVDPTLLLLHEIIWIDRWIPEYPSRLDRQSRILWNGYIAIDPFLEHPVNPPLPPPIVILPDDKDYIRKWLGDTIIGTSGPLSALTEPTINGFDKDYIRKWLGDLDPS